MRQPNEITVNDTTLDKVLEKHQAWLKDEPTGEKADLRGANLRWADLRWANLREADLREANLDFSAFPLWCYSTDIQACDRLATQLMYHACALDYSACSPEVKQALDQIRSVAEKFRDYQPEAPTLIEDSS